MCRKPIITAKSTLKREEMLDKKNKGAENMEVHLTNECLEVGDDFEGYLELIKEVGMEITVVHTPIEYEYHMESLASDENFSKIRKSMLLANKIGVMQGTEVKVIMHMIGNMGLFKRTGILNTIIFSLKSLMEQFKNIKICLENYMIANIHGTDGVTSGNSNKETNLEFVEYVNKRLPNSVKGLGLVLDTCHVISDERLVKHLGLDGKDMKGSNISLESFFELYKDNLEVIHLANAIDYGVREGHHAQPFKTGEDIELLKEIIEMIKGIGYEGILTLEVNEDNYKDSKNWELTRKQIKEFAGW